MAKDPYQYFRIEAREHVEGLTSGVLNLEKGGSDQALVDRLLRHAHTLKGAARVVRQPEIAELSHSMETVLAAARDSGGVLNREQANELLQLVDSVNAHLSTLTEPGTGTKPSRVPGDVPAGASDRHAGTLETVRIQIAELDPLLHGIWEVGIHLASLREQASMLLGVATDNAATRGSGTTGLRGTAFNLVSSTDRPAVREQLIGPLRQAQRILLDRIEKAERELIQLQDRAGQFRLLPASSLFSGLERAVRDTADALGRQVEFRTSGGGNRLDAHVLRGLSDAMLHLVRNAVSHGIESPEQRVAGGKPVTGRVEVAVERHGNRMRFTCRDDGRGIDVTEVARAATEVGLIPAGEEQSLTPDQAVQLVFRAGVSTAAAVTQHAGRGIGLDAVRETIERLGGTVVMESSPSAGTVVRIEVPLLLESIAVLNVEVAGRRTSVPFESVHRVFQVSESDIARTPEGDSLLYKGVPVPIVSLRQLLFPELPPQSSPATKQVMVILGAEGKMAAAAIDRIVGRTTVVLKPLPALISGESGLVIGAFLDGAGDPQIVLDPACLVDASRQTPGATRPVAMARPCVLVIDDSLTTRMLEQSILETAGYQVDLAVSGEEALVKARQREYAIFIVDIEMPGMNGFEFIEKVKMDPDLQHVPALLVSSRGNADDRARGQAAGAAAHIVKSEFEESAFLGTIRRLVR